MIQQEIRSAKAIWQAYAVSRQRAATLSQELTSGDRAEMERTVQTMMNHSMVLLKVEPSNALRYQLDTLCRNTPHTVLDELSAGATVLQWQELEVYASVPMPREPQQNRAFLGIAVQRCGRAPDAPVPSSLPRFELPANQPLLYVPVKVAAFMLQEELARFKLGVPAIAPSHEPSYPPWRYKISLRFF